jgi:ABC-type transporter Mla maintaining outer membrane lipid asymmetry permease subunit MlaE
MMRKVAAILSGLAMAVSFIFPLRFLVATDLAAGCYVIVPVMTFACALAIYTGHITGPWPRSLTWLLKPAC